MTQKDNADPAFPQSMGGGEFGIRPMPGMTLRDWFAGQALVGLSASPHNMVVDGYHGEFATHAYMLADALLAARSAE